MPASDEGEQAIKKFIVAPGFSVELFAAEPQLANPVCFTVDFQGRFYVAETFRHHAGVTDMRGHQRWLDDDLAARTPEDRLAEMKKNLGLDYIKYTTEHERIRQIEDRDGDGRADHDTIFADGFKDPLDGIAAGLLVDRGDVYYTCLPHLWKLRDSDGDGKADSRVSLSEGYGVHIGFLGHDMHGLRKGPDGKIYFSIGDRGVHIKTPDGVIALPDTGAVFRCNRDGSGLEVVHTGLRNPQELAFDDYGNLFTGDNNSDGGDKARLVYVVEGGDSGWHYGFQWITDPNQRGPWNSEKMWEPQWEGQAAYIVPPLINVAAGPSGFTYYPGTGMPEKYQKHFFLCDFRGNSTGSLIHTFTLAPKGAYFEMKDREDFIKGVLVTDADFGMNGGLYLTDWVEGWDKPAKGRIYRVFSPEISNDPSVKETKKLLSEGMTNRAPDELGRLLHHPDRRVRLEAQYALADLGEPSLDIFIRAALQTEHELEQMHGIWGLGQLAEQEKTETGRAVGTLLTLLADPNPEVRAQSAKILGQRRVAHALEPLLKQLRDDHPRVRFFAAIALSRLGNSKAFEPLIQVLRENNDADPYIRHACVMGLLGTGSPDLLLRQAADESPAVRMGVLLALRRLGNPEIARFLEDSNPRIVAEAARAIGDVPIDPALPSLARVIENPDKLKAVDQAMNTWMLDARALNANLRLGGPDNAAAVAKFAARSDASEDARAEALKQLRQWRKPSGRDRIVGLWRPLPERDGKPVAEALEPVLEGMLRSPSGRIQVAAAELAGTYEISSASETLMALLKDPAQPLGVRTQSLKSLAALKAPQYHDAIRIARADAEPVLRREGNAQLIKLDPEQAIGILTKSLASGSTEEMQGAFIGLGSVESERANGMLSEWLDKLIARSTPREVELDLIEAAKARKDSELNAKLARFQKLFAKDDPIGANIVALAGGQKTSGEKIFFEKAETTCQKCHAIGEKGGGEVGPDLSHIGSKKDRKYVLEAILKPNLAIAEGYENVTLTLAGGGDVTGRVLRESGDEIELEIPLTESGEEFVEDAKEVKKPAAKTDAGAKPAQFEKRIVRKGDVKSRKRNLSSMPDDISESLSQSELRDLVEFLASRQ